MENGTMILDMLSVPYAISQPLDAIGSNRALEMIREGFKSSNGVVRIASTIKT